MRSSAINHKRDTWSEDDIGSSQQFFHVTKPSLYDGRFETNKVLKPTKFLWKEQVMKFTEVKIAVKLIFFPEEVMFAIFYVKVVSKAVP